jgi:hypothetical protein
MGEKALGHHKIYVKKCLTLFKVIGLMKVMQSFDLRCTMLVKK